MHTATDRPQPLSALAHGFMRSYVLSTAARLGVADALADTEQSIGELAHACDADPSSLHRLLRALASFGIVAEVAPSRFRLTPMGQPLRKTVPGSEWADVLFWADLLADSWSRLTESVRSGESAFQVAARLGITTRWAQAANEEPSAQEIFRLVMGTTAVENYLPIAQAWDFSRSTLVADLGGGGGALLSAVLQANPHLHGLLADRPDALPRAEARLSADGLAGRTHVQAADLCIAIPTGADVYLMKHVLHGYDDQAAITILRNCREAMLPGAHLLIIEFVLPDTVPAPDAALETRLMSDLNMLVATGGKERSALQWRALLDHAGFPAPAILPVPGDVVSIIAAANPDSDTSSPAPRK
jgi:hypothetical protein